MLPIRHLIKLIIKNDLILPLFLLISYLIFLIIARGVVPSSEELIDTFASLYQKYGYEIIFVAALLEGLVLVNLFVPGMLALALGAIFARTGQTELTSVIIIAALGIISGYILDFILGFYGFADFIKKAGYGHLLDEASSQLKKFGKRGLIVGFFHSTVGSFLALAAGTLKLSWLSFLVIAISSTLIWATIWGLLVYSLGDIFLVLVKKYSFLFVLLIISGLVIARLWKNDKNNK